MPTHPNNTENGITGLVINLHNEIIEASRLAFEVREVEIVCELTTFNGMSLAVSTGGRTLASVLLSGEFEECLTSLGTDVADTLEDAANERHDGFMAGIRHNLEELRNMVNNIDSCTADEAIDTLHDIINTAHGIENNIDKDLFKEVDVRMDQVQALRDAIAAVGDFGKIHVDAPSPKFIMHGSLATVTTAVDPVVEAARREVNHPANFDIYGFDGGIDPVGR